MSECFCIARLLLLLNLMTYKLNAQPSEAEKINPGLLIKLEIRPRAEFTSNYLLAPNDSVSPYVNLTQRNRLTTSMERKFWLFKSEFQEIHFWDKQSINSKPGSVNFYQLFFETKFKRFNVRTGRQSVLLDNGRIFSDAPWAQQGRAHEGIRFMYRTSKVNADLFLLFGRKYVSSFLPAFSPVSSHRYKYMLVFHYKYVPNNHFFINTIQAMDIFLNKGMGKLFYRITTGGRFELKRDNWLYTLNTYLQLGQTQNGKQLLAHYIQPELQWINQKIILRLGLESLSGSSPKLSINKSGDFDVPYGVAWKFNGNMNLFTKFPADVSGKGLLNPYFFASLQITKKTLFRSDYHLFYTHYPFKNANGLVQNRFLGFENDISFRHLVKKHVEFTGGFSYFTSSRSAKFLPKIVDYRKITLWSYLMVSVTWENKRKLKHFNN